MRVGLTGKLVVKMNIPVAVRNATSNHPLLIEVSSLKIGQKRAMR